MIVKSENFTLKILTDHNPYFFINLYCFIGQDFLKVLISICKITLEKDVLSQVNYYYFCKQIRPLMFNRGRNYLILLLFINLLIFIIILNIYDFQEVASKFYRMVTYHKVQDMSTQARLLRHACKDIPANLSSCPIF